MASLTSLIESTLGYQFIGFTIAMACYGITVVQTYIYYCNYKEDGRALKAFVYLLLVLDTLCSALVAHALYVALIVNWGDLVALETFTWSFALENGITVLITFLVQCFFAVRVQLLPKNLALASAAIALTGLVSFGAGIALTSQLFITKFHVDALQSRFFTVTCIVDQGAAALCDIIVTVSFTYGLLSERFHGAKQTAVVIEVLVSYFVTRGVLTTIIQILAVVTFSAMRTKDVWFLGHLIVSKVYINTMLAILNSRRDLRKVIDKTVELTGIDFRERNTDENTTPGVDMSFSRTDPTNLRTSEKTKHDVVIDIQERLMFSGEQSDPSAKGDVDI